jgi:hypothetical protein
MARYPFQGERVPVGMPEGGDQIPFESAQADQLALDPAIHDYRAVAGDPEGAVGLGPGEHNVTRHRGADRRAEGGRAALSRGSRVAVERHELRTGGFERHRVLATVDEEYPYHCDVGRAFEISLARIDILGGKRCRLASIGPDIRLVALQFGKLGCRHRILEPLGATIRRIGLFDPPTVEVGPPEDEQHIECRRAVGDGPAVSGDLEQARRHFEVRGCPERIRCVESAFSRRDQHAGRQRPGQAVCHNADVVRALARIYAFQPCQCLGESDVQRGRPAGAQQSGHSLADDRHAHPQPVAARHHEPGLLQLGQGDVEARM